MGSGNHWELILHHDLETHAALDELLGFLEGIAQGLVAAVVGMGEVEEAVSEFCHDTWH